LQQCDLCEYDILEDALLEGSTAEVTGVEDGVVEFAV
jgi:hypothetical protein